MQAEQAPADARTQAALLSSTGLSVSRRIGSGPIRAMNDDLPGRIYLVSGTRFYRIRFELTELEVDDLGEIGIPDQGVIPPYETMITIAAGATAAVVCVPPRAYTCGHNLADTLNQIGGPDFPGAATVAFHDGYFVYTDYSNSARFFISRLLDPTLFNALDFAFSDGLPNVLRRVISSGGYLWMMGEGGVEVWYDAGNQDFPYRRLGGGVIPFTVANAQSCATGDTSVFWVGHNDIVYRTEGLKATRISTHAVEAVVRSFGAFAVVSAFCYGREGHIFYCLNFPTRSLVYDTNTKVWHDRASDGSLPARWRVDCIARAGTDVLAGDAWSNVIFRLEADGFAAGFEDATPITRQITFPPIWADTHRAFCHRVEVEMESGNGALVDGLVTLDWSDDGGFTWTGGPRVMTAMLGAFNKRQRVVATRLGSFRQRVFRLTMRGAATIYAVDADIAGANW